MADPKTFEEIKEEGKRNRQDIILDAAERAFSVKPFNKVSMRDIAREAGISHAAIYRHFPDQQTLFVEAFLRGIKNLSPMLKETIEKEKIDTIEHAAETYVDFLADNDQYFRMMTHFMLDGTLSEELIVRLNEVERSLLNLFDHLFCDAKSNEKMRIHSHSFFAALNGVLITFRDYPGRKKEEVRKHMKRLARNTALVFKKGTQAV